MVRILILGTLEKFGSDRVVLGKNLRSPVALTTCFWYSGQGLQKYVISLEISVLLQFIKCWQTYYSSKEHPPCSIRISACYLSVLFVISSYSNLVIKTFGIFIWQRSHCLLGFGDNILLRIWGRLGVSVDCRLLHAVWGSVEVYILSISCLTFEWGSV